MLHSKRRKTPEGATRARRIGCNPAVSKSVAEDIFVTLIPVPNESFSFGRGEFQLS